MERFVYNFLEKLIKHVQRSFLEVPSQKKKKKKVYIEVFLKKKRGLT